MNKKFLKFVVPSMITFFVTGIYVGIDGFFVGRTVGDVGLGSINIAWPLVALLSAIGTGIGMGGSINISNYLGSDQKVKADRVLVNTLVVLLIFSIILSFFLLMCGKQMLVLMGASGQLLEMSYGYLRILAYGAGIQVFATGVTPLLRNQDKPITAMFLMIGNFVVDTVLSGIFVMILGFGVKGAAIGTLIGQSIVLIPALVILLKKESRIDVKHNKIDIKIFAHILKSAAPIFGLSFIPSLTILIINKQAIIYGGTTAIAAFAVISYILSIGQLLLQGVGEGSQPLISFYNGANDKPAVKQLRRWTYLIGFLISVLSVIIIILLRGIIPGFFGVSSETSNLLIDTLPICALSLPFYAFSRITTEFFNAIKKSSYATFMVYGEALVLLPLMAIVAPLILKLNGVWWTIVMVQLFISVVGIYLRYKYKILDNINISKMDNEN